MKLIVHELITTLYQTINVGARPLQVYAIRPHLYKHLAPTGSLSIQIQDSYGRLVKASSAIAIADVSASNYFHGLVRFPIVAQLQANTQYRIALVPSGGYAFAEAAYIGWCNDYDLRRVAADYTPADGIRAPLGLEIWTNENYSRRAR